MTRSVPLTITKITEMVRVEGPRSGRTSFVTMNAATSTQRKMSIRVVLPTGLDVLVTRHSSPGPPAGFFKPLVPSGQEDEAQNQTGGKGRAAWPGVSGERTTR